MAEIILYGTEIGSRNSTLEYIWHTQGVITADIFRSNCMYRDRFPLTNVAKDGKISLLPALISSRRSKYELATLRTI